MRRLEWPQVSRLACEIADRAEPLTTGTVITANTKHARLLIEEVCSVAHVKSVNRAQLEIVFANSATVRFYPANERLEERLRGRLDSWRMT